MQFLNQICMKNTDKWFFCGYKSSASRITLLFQIKSENVVKKSNYQL